MGTSLTIFSDGGARGNPGPAASAYAIYQGDKLLAHSAKYIGHSTNNVAEYNGVILALQWVAKQLAINNLQFTMPIKFCLDSELVVKQLTGVYKIKDKKLIELSLKVKRIIKDNNLKISFIHIPREKNKLADKLVNEKLDDTSL